MLKTDKINVKLCMQLILFHENVFITFNCLFIITNYIYLFTFYNIIVTAHE